MKYPENHCLLGLKLGTSKLDFLSRFFSDAALSTQVTNKHAISRQGHHSLLAALCHSSLVPVVRLRCGNRAVTLPSHLLLIGDTVECPSHPLLLAYLHTAECKCKCKTFLLSNSALSPTQLEFLDSTSGQNS